MKVSIANKEYTFLIGYRSQDLYRAAFNNLAKKVFGISFEDWYQLGYWNEKYIPYTLFDEETAIANISVNTIDFNILGDHKRYIQIGTVMTDDNYRNQNLCRFLMESVLEFYPKFGFKPVTEYTYFRRVEKDLDSGNCYKKLDSYGPECVYHLLISMGV